MYKRQTIRVQDSSKTQSSTARNAGSDGARKRVEIKEPQEVKQPIRPAPLLRITESSNTREDNDSEDDDFELSKYQLLLIYYFPDVT